MTLDEAIKHCKEKAEELREQPFKEKMDIEDIADCEECAEEHEQLAEWLEDYKRLLEERTQGDLISREALKKCAIPCEVHNGTLTDLCVPLYQIDNSPSVETSKIEHKAYNEGFKDGVEQGIKLSQGQKGEWIDHSEDYGYVECPICEHLTNCDGNKDELHYCWYCGAKMGKVEQNEI